MNLRLVRVSALTMIGMSIMVEGMKSPCNNFTKNCLNGVNFAEHRNNARKDEVDLYDPDYKQKVILLEASDGLGR